MKMHAGARPPRARPWRRGSPDPVPNSEVKPAVAESTAAPGCGRVGCRARGVRIPCAGRAPPDPSGGALSFFRFGLLAASLCAPHFFCSHVFYIDVFLGDGSSSWPTGTHKCRKDTGPVRPFSRFYL